MTASVAAADMPAPGIRLRLRTKLAIAITAALLLTVAALTYAMYSLAVREISQEFGRKLMAVAATGTLVIDGDAFASLRMPAQMSSSAYPQVQDQLRRVRTINPEVHLRFIYTMAPSEHPGIWRYIVDAEDAASPDFSRLGATEDFAYDPVWQHPIEHPVAESIRFYPGWGAIMSASAPIRDASGHAVGVLSVDAQADTVLATMRGCRQRALLVGLLGVVMSFVISLPLAWHVTRPVNALMAGTQAVRRGDLQHLVVVANRDELGELANAFNRMTAGLRERELYKRQFERYVSRQVADKILAQPEKAFWDGERRQATILFSDIRGFTALAERIPPEEVILRLNEYLAQMIDIVFAHEGTLDKFIGDAVMEVFGAPMSFGDDALRAVRTALAMQQGVRTMSAQWEQDGRPGFRIGIGIHTGDVVVGTIGSERRMEYSAIGDTVNLASRLEHLTKDYGVGILISASTYQAVKHAVDARFVAEVAIRGREQPIEVYEVLGLTALTSE